MTLEARVVASASRVPPDGDLVRLRDALDLAAMVAAGYDPLTRIFTSAPEHPIFGFRVCIAPGCDSAAKTAKALCGACHERLKRARRSNPNLTDEDFAREPRPF